MKTYKFFCGLTAATLIMTSANYVTAFADDGDYSLGQISDEYIISIDTDNSSSLISTRGTKVPTAVHNLSNEEYSGEFYPLYKGKYTNTSKKFSTSSTEITINFDLTADYNYTYKRTMTFELYSTPKNSTSWTLADSDTFSFTPDEHNEYKVFSGSITFSGLSSNKYYYIKFRNSSSGNQSTNTTYYSIGGDFTITD